MIPMSALLRPLLLVTASALTLSALKIDKDYHRMASERLEKERSQVTIFDMENQHNLNK